MMNLRAHLTIEFSFLKQSKIAPYFVYGCELTPIAILLQKVAVQLLEFLFLRIILLISKWFLMLQKLDRCLYLLNMVPLAVDIFAIAIPG